MKDFILKPRISPSDNEFKKKIGEKDWVWLRKQLRLKHKFTCFGCGLELPDKPHLLDPHVVSGAPEDVNSVVDMNNIEIILLCRACHITQHMDVAVKQKSVDFVNSCLSQRELITNGRMGYTQIENLIQNNSIIELDDVNTSEYLEELKKISFVKISKIKVVLNKEFDWNDAK